MSVKHLLDLFRPASVRTVRHIRSERPREARAAIERLEGRTLFATYSAGDVDRLIAHIHAANQTPEADTIDLLPGVVYTLTAVNNTTDGPTGLPVIGTNTALTVNGNGATVERSAARETPGFRLFDVPAGATLTLANMTLQGGRLQDSAPTSMGGAVYSQGRLTLDSVTVQNNAALGHERQYVWTYGFAPGNAAGGGVYSKGQLTVTKSTFRNNLAEAFRGIDGVQGGVFGGELGTGGYATTAGGNASGGGLYVAGGTASVVRSTFTANTARGGDGGDGDYHYDGTSARLPAPGGNAFGGGIHVAAGTAAFQTSTITDNVVIAGTGGGGYTYQDRRKTKVQPPAPNGLARGAGLYVAGGATVRLDVGNVGSNYKDIFGSYQTIL